MWFPIISDTSVIVINTPSSISSTIFLSSYISILVRTQYKTSFFPEIRPSPCIVVVVLPNLLYISLLIPSALSVIINAAFACSNPSETTSITL